MSQHELAALAVDIEAQGVQLYTRCIALFPEKREGLARALDQEREHHRAFVKLEAELAQTGEAHATDADRAELLSSLASDLSLPAGLMEIAEEGSESLSALLGRMIAAESLSIAFYHQAGTESPAVAAIASAIAREEGDHKRSLEALRAEALEREKLLTAARDRLEDWRRIAKEPEEIAELDALLDDESALFDAFWRELEFATAGMRGLIGLGSNRMNRYNVRRATQGLARLLIEQGEVDRGVVIAYDSRRCSREFALEAALVLCRNGIATRLFPSLRPVPILSFSVRHLGAAAGIVITASHNPKEYNGYKVYGPDGAQMTPEATEKLVAHIERYAIRECQPMAEDIARKRGLLRDVEAAVDDAYIEAVKGLCVSPDLCREMGERLSILYTPLNGSGSVPVRRILDEVGFARVSLVAEQVDPDPDFTTVGTPNPENASAFALALEQAKAEQPDVIFGTDPDADRLGVAVKGPDGAYTLLTGNQIGCLLMHYVLSAHRDRGTLPPDGAVVKSIVSTQMAAAIAADFGVAMIDVLTGFKFIAEQIASFEETGSHTFLFGFEESYGFLAGTFVRDKDAVIASMLLAETAAWYKQRGMTLYDGLMSLYERYGHYGEKVISITLAGKEGQDHIAEIMSRLRLVPPTIIGGYRVLAIRDLLSGSRTALGGVMESIDLPSSDVLYYELEDNGWVCVRPSGTEPKIKLYFNAAAPTAEQTGEALADMEADMRRRME